MVFFYLPPGMQAYMYVLTAILGACAGSFLGCLSWRIVHKESMLKGRSHCDLCNHVLGLRDLVPVFSFLFHRGKCRFCGAKLSSRYLWGEIVSALVFISALRKWGLSWELVEFLLLGSILLATSFADLEATIIPNRFVIAAASVRVVFILTSGDILHELLFSVLGGVCIAGGVLLVVLIFEKIIKREAMGGGDIKLLFVTGLFLGWKLNLLGLLMGCVIGILFGICTRNSHKVEEDPRAFPFGPSIAMGAWISLLVGEGILNAYFSLF